MYPFRLLADLRPSSNWSVYSAPVYRRDGSHPVEEHRFAVRWDEDNDQRVIGAIQALYYISPRCFRFCHAYGEHKGMLTVWHLDLSEEVQAALAAALSQQAALEGDIWTLELINNYLPPRDAPPEQLAALELSVAAQSSAVRIAFDRLASQDPTITAPALMISNLKPQYRPRIDRDLAALHQHFGLGSFGEQMREWHAAAGV
jgi:hypothetical protein